VSAPVIYLPGAEDDIVAAHAEYETHLEGLGDRFTRALRDQVERIARMPELYGEVAAGVRATPLRHFPYVVYYRIDADRVVILSVTHGRRARQGWEDRI
jgi:plasmid stabilization system protein ParE